MRKKLWLETDSTSESTAARPPTRPSASIAATATLSSAWWVRATRVGTAVLLRRRPSTCAASAATAALSCFASRSITSGSTSGLLDATSASTAAAIRPSWSRSSRSDSTSASAAGRPSEASEATTARRTDQDGSVSSCISSGMDGAPSAVRRSICSKRSRSCSESTSGAGCELMRTPSRRAARPDPRRGARRRASRRATPPPRPGVTFDCRIALICWVTSRTWWAICCAVFACSEIAEVSSRARVRRSAVVCAICSAAVICSAVAAPTRCIWVCCRAAVAASAVTASACSPTARDVCFATRRTSSASRASEDERLALLARWRG